MGQRPSAIAYVLVKVLKKDVGYIEFKKNNFLFASLYLPSNDVNELIKI